MRSPQSRLIVLSALVLAPVVVATGCAAKKPAAGKPALPAPSVGEPPKNLTVTLNTTVKPEGTITSIYHDATEPRRPGDTVQFDAKAVVPQGFRISVEVSGTNWAPVDLIEGSGPGLYTGSAVIPDVAPGSYKVRARLISEKGKELKSLVASSPLNIVARLTPCEDLQKKFDDLRAPFDYDKAEINDAAKKVIQQVAALIKSAGITDLKVQLVGHCDQRGTQEYNIALGGKRAAQGRTYLVSLGAVKTAQTSTDSKGKMEPLDPAENEQAYAKNRRVEFKAICPAPR